MLGKSHELALSVVSDPVILQGVDDAKPGEKLEAVSLSKDYLKEAGHDARRRVIAAGIRLAALLNQR